MVSFPYYSHIFRDPYASGMGIVWVPLTIRGSHVLGVPENPIEFVGKSLIPQTLKGKSTARLIPPHFMGNEQLAAVQTSVEG